MLQFSTSRHAWLVSLLVISPRNHFVHPLMLTEVFIVKQVVFFFSYSTEAHKRYGGMGTILVNKVGVWSMAFRRKVMKPKRNECCHYIHFTAVYVGYMLLLGFLYRFLPNQLISLVHWSLIRSQMNCCITQRNLRLLYDVVLFLL